MYDFDVAVLLFRLLLGGVMIAHGCNHLFGPGGVEGTARWFGGMGFAPARMHALMSGWIEIAAGGALVLGLFTPFAAAAVVGVMAVAGWVAHRPNGLFVFRDGYEYVLVLAVCAVVLAMLGPGRLSLDHALGVTGDGGQLLGLTGWAGGLVAAGAGLGGAVVLLATSWKAPGEEPPGESAETRRAR
ncbi:DoxX family protein [Streptomyces albipurpureus]|uniref:DoxX family protein n=1 Tax=Streptomyces albipurpureus TaxID=2897419 RepID=A0ABT0UMI1_9ACTN|nr:DoxX family protein [Streptomyces sp. CWNU-1]MCM2389639.1 DoxX family protein [Streptomyces sp. CWNU-1]